MVSGIFALFLQVTKIRKIRKIFEAACRLVPETGRSQATNLETQKRTKRIEIHQSQIKNQDLLNSFKWTDFS